MCRNHQSELLHEHVGVVVDPIGLSAVVGEGGDGSLIDAVDL
jgi:hypothetical protein